MRVSLSWLRDWLDFDATPVQVADALTRRGFYVEGIETHGGEFPGVVVARVLEVAKHPNADKLSLCRVDGGAGELSVVCGASNVRAGMMVPLATVGARLPDGTTIRKSKIRGEESRGMLCSARELELSDEHEGIVDLVTLVGATDGLTPGRPFGEVLGPPETVFEIEIPFNRPDTLGVIGLARELRAACAGAWTSSAMARFGDRWRSGDAFDLELEDAEGCPRYIAQSISGVTIGPSPTWLTRRLEAVGQRPINNVVDLTNFILFEFGQPLHAFDLDRLEGPAIRVRRARLGETIVTLDGKQRALDPEVLVIADRKHPVAVAGVMGGAASEVHQGTKALLLECAWFDPTRVRRGARRLGLATEASKRYERGVDSSIGPVAAARFLALLREICPGAELGPARGRDLTPHRPNTIALRSSRCTRVIGAPVTAAEAAAALVSLEFELSGSDPLEVTVPPWRIDVAIEDDLVEEVARARGYDRIPEKSLETGGAYAVRSSRERTLERARRAMLARGITEALTPVLVSESEAVQCAGLLGADAADLVRLTNPMSRESEVLRPSPLVGLLRACAHNQRQGSQAVRLFEIGSGFSWPDAAAREGSGGSGRAADPELPEERSMIVALVTGARFAHAHDALQQPVDFEDAKGLWDAFLEEMGVDTPEWRTYAAPGWKPAASAEVAGAGSRIGWAGTLAQSLLREWEIETEVHVFLGLVEGLPEVARQGVSVTLPGRFPPARRDVAFFVPVGVTHGQLEATLAAAGGERLVSLELFDVYIGLRTPEGMKSMAFALRFQHPERTMTEAEVQSIQDRMVAAVAKECAGRLRER